MNRPTRREFAATALAASLCLRAPLAAEPIARSGRPRIRLSLAAYSFRADLDLKRQPKPRMTLDDFIDLAADTDTEAIEPTAYFFADTTPATLARLKGRCTRLGLDVSGTAIGNDFATADPAKRKTQQEYVRKWVEHTARLGGKTVRIFAGKPPAGEPEETVRARCVDAIGEACEHAGRHGIYLAIENHDQLTGSAEKVLAIVKAVKSDWFGVNLDTGNFHTADPYADMTATAPYAVTVQVKTEIQPAGKPKEEADLKRVVALLREANYRGYIALEYEAGDDPHVAVPKYLKVLRGLLG